MREGEKRPADPVDAFKSGAWVGGNKLPTGEGFPPVGLMGTGDEVVNLIDSSMTGKDGHCYYEETPSRASQ